LFTLEHGIIPACDVKNLTKLDELIKNTHDLDFIQAYKIGMNLVIQFGLNKIVNIIRKYTNIPIIYDHQKFGTDIPDICSGDILNIIKQSGIDYLIIFPQAGIETLKATVNACNNLKITPIIGGDMTHKGYLKKENGYLCDDSPLRIYTDASKLAVNHFVIPGTKIKEMLYYKNEIIKSVKKPRFLFPGIGKGQGGDILQAFRTVYPYSSYAIIGRGIYQQKDMKQSAVELWNNVREEIRDMR